MDSCTPVILGVVLGNVKTKIRPHVLKHDLLLDWIFLPGTVRTFRKVKNRLSFQGRLL
jgi:hypothetical protein